MTLRYGIRLVPLVAGVATTLRYAEEAYTNVAYTPPLVEDRVTQISFDQHMFGQNRIRGPLELGDGSVVLFNVDGALDGFLNYRFDSQPFEVYRYDDANPSVTTCVYQGVMEPPTFQEDSVTIPLRDYLFLFEKPLLTDRYGGTNSLPNGLDGVADDIKGKVKPFTLGAVFNVSSVLVNSSRLIYQLNSEKMLPGIAIAGFDQRAALAKGPQRTLSQMQSGSTSGTCTADAVTDKITAVLPAGHGFNLAPYDLDGPGPNYVVPPDGVYFTSTGTLPGGIAASTYYYVRATNPTDYTLHPTPADAAANTNVVNITSAGTGTLSVIGNATLGGSYDWCYDTAGTYIRLGVKPIGRVTFDATSAVIATQLQQIFGNYTAKLAPGASPASDFPALPDDMGTYLDGETGGLEAIRPLMDSAQLGLTTKLTGVFSSPPTLIARAIAAPAGTTFDLDEAINIDSLECVQRADPERDTALGKVTVGYKKNYTVMGPSDVAGAVTLETLAMVSKEYRTVAPYILAGYADAPELTLNTLYAAATAPSAIGSSVATNSTRRLFRVTCSDLNGFMTYLLSKQTAFGSDAGVKLKHRRYGLGAGVVKSIFGYEVNVKDRTVTVTCG